MSGTRIGSGPLNICTLVWLSVASALYGEKCFTGVLSYTMKWLMDTRGFSQTELGRKQLNAKRRKISAGRSKHDPRRQDPTKVSEEGFTKARRVPREGFWSSLLSVLHREFEKEYGELTKWKGFRLLALDGSKIDLPRRKAIGDQFGRAKNGRGEFTPQAQMVMLQHPLVRIPVDFAIGGSNSSEKLLARDLLHNLRRDDLVLMDRGFWSYGLFWLIQNQGAYFGLRWMGSAKLSRIKKLGPYDQLVGFAPSDHKWRKAGLPESMELRLIQYQIKGFRPSAVLTKCWMTN
ncbi:MAG: transposase [Planctomycetota bacterium]